MLHNWQMSKASTTLLGVLYLERVLLYAGYVKYMELQSNILYEKYIYI